MSDEWNSSDTQKVVGRFSPFPGFGGKTQQTVMPLIASDGETWIPVGTGFMIGGVGLLMTAAHVVGEANRHRKRKNSAFGESVDHLELHALYLTNEPVPNKPGMTMGCPLPISKVWWNKSLDIAVCKVSRLEIDGAKRIFPTVRLALGWPKAGEQVVGVGYHGMKAEFQRQPESWIAKITQETALTRGKVIEIFPGKRDSAMLSFPCFRTDARFDPGMSGGPVFQENGSVCGVICSSLSGEPESTDHISYASLIWPALAIKLDVCEDGRTQKMSLLDLARRKFVAVDGDLDSVSLTSNGVSLCNLLRDRKGDEESD